MPGRPSNKQLQSLVERIERLEEEKKAIADDIKGVYDEAKFNGFDVTALRTVIKLRKQDPEERKEQEAILETYLAALGMLPLEAAIARVGAKNVEAREALDTAAHESA
jgi:uncharacterized protein (UPF0335 family)